MNRLPVKPIIYFISTGDTDEGNFALKKQEIVNKVRVAAELGVSLIQIREKKLTARSLFDLTKSVVDCTKSFNSKILVNGRADIALAAGADGVHLPADGLSPETIRRSFPVGFVIGVSSHTYSEAYHAKLNSADFVTFGPIFESPGKGRPQGIAMLKNVCKLLDPFPVFALGGIDELNYPSVLENGAAGIAAIRLLNDEDKLRKLFLESRMIDAASADFWKAANSMNFYE